ncbi:hypothetical protein HGA34_01015 [Candidatus Falkowbacteria bacterium]|nr:hypothetical protein [Candidatus Falkowbacteria bacterium]
MIRFPNGKILPSVVLSTIGGHYGSGMFPYIFDAGYNHLMSSLPETRTAILTKSATYNKRVGNVVMHKPWTAYQYIRRIKDRGMVNAYGLTNPGINECVEGIGKAIARGYNAIPNFYPEFVKNGVDRLEEAIRETIVAIRCFKYNLGEAFWAVELNFSCPNSEEEIAKNMQQVLQCLAKVREELPFVIIIAKVSWMHPIEFFEEIATKKLADALHCFNTIPYELVFGAGTRSPLKNGLGGVSGGPIRELCFTKNQEVAKRVNLPIIMGGGVPVEPFDAAKPYFDIGASAISVCTDAAYLPYETLALINRHL